MAEQLHKKEKMTFPQSASPVSAGFDPNADSPTTSPILMASRPLLLALSESQQPLYAPTTTGTTSGDGEGLHRATEHGFGGPTANGGAPFGTRAAGEDAQAPASAPAGTMGGQQPLSPTATGTRRRRTSSRAHSHGDMLTRTLSQHHHHPSALHVDTGGGGGMMAGGDPQHSSDDDDDEEPTMDFALLQRLLAAPTPAAADHLAASVLGGTSHGLKSAAAITAARISALHRSWDANAKYTFFSTERGVVQGQTLAGLAGKTPLFSPRTATPTAATSPVVPDSDGDDGAETEPFWLDVHRPTPTDLALLARALSIHPLTLEDMMADEEVREKSEVYDHYLFVCLRTVATEDDDAYSVAASGQSRAMAKGDDSLGDGIKLGAGSPLADHMAAAAATHAPVDDGLRLRETFVYVLLFRNCVVTVHAGGAARHVRSVATRLVTGAVSAESAASAHHGGGAVHHVTATAAAQQASSAPTRLAPDWVLYSLVDDVIDALRPVIMGLEFDADGIDDLSRILRWTEQQDLQQRCKRATKKVTQLIRMMHFKEEVIKSLSNRAAHYIAPTTVVYLRDIFDHIVTLQHTLAITKETLHNAYAGYHSQLSVAMSQVSNDMNEQMRKVTVMGAVFVPLTAVTGAFGMNVTVPWKSQDGDVSVLVFLCIIGFSLCLSAVLVAFIAYSSKRR
ncbi:hypothetical protein BC828DRAFT_392381 [Blastocladiella britannica]|nr:hypothetical protein BC828DRAFT_392381 [Blastocladiella britannica]